MAVNWECSECEAYLTAKKFADDSKEWREFADLRESLIWALLVTGFPPKSEWAITEKNWEQVYARLKALETVSGAYRIYTPLKKGEPRRKVYFTPEEIHSMIGLAVNAGNKSPTEWKNWLVNRIAEDSDAALRLFHKKREAA
jgi:hypothetical protein